MKSSVVKVFEFARQVTTVSHQVMIFFLSSSYMEPLDAAKLIDCIVDELKQDYCETHVSLEPDYLAMIKETAQAMCHPSKTSAVLIYYFTLVAMFFVCLLFFFCFCICFVFVFIFFFQLQL